MKYILLLFSLIILSDASLAYMLPFSCAPDSDDDICKVIYNVTFDSLKDNGYPKVEVSYESGQHRLPRIGGTPPYNVTTREIMIDGVKGMLMNVSRFSNVDDAIHAQKLIDPTFPLEYTLDEVKSEWTKFGSLDGEMLEMYAYYNLSERGNDEYGWVLLYGKIVDKPGKQGQLTSVDMMHAIKAIHVTEAGR